VKKIAVLWAATLCLSMGACCSVNTAALGQLEANDKLILPAYLKYVDADPVLSKEQKDDRKKLVESRGRLFEAIKK